MSVQRSNKPMRYRQIHLDFHTSEHIPNIGKDFDAADFVATLKKAHVDSITIFAKCHHGWAYYPTEIGGVHPHLSRPDLLGEMVEALTAADIECPIYITVQWDERNARLHPEWRVRAASENRFDPAQLYADWHTICLNHKAYRDELLGMAREVASRYATPGIFFDIVFAPDCVCQQCLDTMAEMGLDPESPADRLTKDEWVNERFRRELSEALDAEFPGLRVFYNCGHIHKQGPKRFEPYTHLELESLPTGGWGYNHFPASARYAATLGYDFVAHTGKFHTSWGEFGGFKHPDALEFEAAQMVALGSKCLVGDQLHPSGAINPDTYASIAPAYARIEKLEPFLEDAVQVSEVAILSAEYFRHGDDRNNQADDGAAQMLQELQQPFDVIDPHVDFSDYRVIILPDEVPVQGEMATRLATYVRGGGKLILSGTSALGSDGKFAVPAGICSTGTVDFEPSYLSVKAGLDPSMTGSPFVVYGRAQAIVPEGAEVLAEVVPPYFNRSYAHFCSHQHAPDDVDAASLGAGVTLCKGVAYVAYPIFSIYRAIGQPLYRYLIRGLLKRLMPDGALETDLPSSGRATLTQQENRDRHVLHLLYGAPQVRGNAVPTRGGVRVMEMIEDIPAIGPVSAKVRLPKPPLRAYEAVSGEPVAVADLGNGQYGITLDRFRIHAAVVFEQNA